MMIKSINNTRHPTPNKLFTICSNLQGQKTDHINPLENDGAKQILKGKGVQFEDMLCFSVSLGLQAAAVFWYRSPSWKENKVTH